MTKPLKQAPRPQNMSQLDYLWTYFGSYEVSDSLDTPNSIPTSEAVKQFVTATEVGIVELGTEELSNNKIKIKSNFIFEILILYIFLILRII